MCFQILPKLSIAGKLFHTCGPATTKLLSPCVEQRVFCIKTNGDDGPGPKSRSPRPGVGYLGKGAASPLPEGLGERCELPERGPSKRFSCILEDPDGLT